MSLSALAVKNRTVTYFFVILLLIGGTGAFFQLGQLEDPEFTVKTAVIVTAYPGASPQEVELEVTDRIELAIQEMPQVDYLKSFSRAGLSLIEVNIKPEYWSDRLPQVWDELRRKVRDIEHQLPPGAGRPDVSDDFGDVFGFQLAVTGDGFSYAELEQYAKDLKKELSLVTGVSRVDLWGVQQKVIYIDVAQQQLSELGMTDESILKTLNQQNMVVDGGSLDLQNNRFRIAPTGDFQSPLEIADVVIRPSLADQVVNLMAAMGSDGAGPQRSDELDALMHNVRRAATEVIEHTPNVPEEALMVLNNIEEPGALADFLAANLSLGLVHKQEFLETFDVKARLLKVHAALESQLSLLRLSEKLQSQVQDQIDKTQRQYYLQQQLKAIREDEVFAEAAGKNVAAYKVLVFVVGASLAAVAGALYAHYISFIDPTSFTVMESILIISMVIIGGAGSLAGPVVGAVFLVVLPGLLRFIGLPGSVAANLRQIIYGGLLVGFMMWRPQGLLGAYAFRGAEAEE